MKNVREEGTRWLGWDVLGWGMLVWMAVVC